MPDAGKEKCVLRQLLYVSVATEPTPRMAEAIFEQSRHNNAIDGVTGLLYTDGFRFMQVLEGSPESIEATFGRIRRDPRHRDLIVLQDGEQEERTFGYWSMASRDAKVPADAFDDRMKLILRTAEPAVRDRFLDLVTERLAA